MEERTFSAASPSPWPRDQRLASVWRSPERAGHRGPSAARAAEGTPGTRRGARPCRHLTSGACAPAPHLLRRGRVQTFSYVLGAGLHGLRHWSQPSGPSSPFPTSRGKGVMPSVMCWLSLSSCLKSLTWKMQALRILQVLPWVLCLLAGINSEA